MQKAILILTGTPPAKNSLATIVKKTCWCWNASAKNRLAEIAKENFYWTVDARDETYHKTLAALYSMVNQTFDFERQYLLQLVERFNAFDKDKMVDAAGNEFTKFLLIVHGISREMTKELEEYEGAMQVHVTSRSLNTNILEHDLVIYEDDPTFEQDVNKIIEQLTNSKKEKI